MTYEQYEHHGVKVWVRSDHKGKHRDECLCWHCAYRNPHWGEPCERAQLLYGLCQRYGMVLVIWECPLFAPEDDTP